MSLTTRRMMNRMDIIKAADLLRQHCTKEGAFAVYAEGWSDDKITHVVGGTAKSSAVASLRVEMFGRLRGYERKPSEYVEIMASSLEDLEKRVGRLTRWAEKRVRDPYLEK